LPVVEVVSRAFIAEQRTEVFGRGVTLPSICTAASVIRDTAKEGEEADPLAIQWSRVRQQPQLSGCLDVTDAGDCAAF